MSGGGETRLVQATKKSVSIGPASLPTILASPQKKAAAMHQQEGQQFSRLPSASFIKTTPAKATIAPAMWNHSGRSPHHAEEDGEETPASARR